MVPKIQQKKPIGFNAFNKRKLKKKKGTKNENRVKEKTKPLDDTT